MTKAKCKDCAQSIGFVETEKGKRMPVDLDLLTTKTESDLVMVEQNFAGRKFHRPVRGTLGAQGYRPHWSSCLRAKDFRK